MLAATRNNPSIQYKMYPRQPVITIDEAIKKANYRIKAPALVLINILLITCFISGLLGDGSILSNTLICLLIGGTFIIPFVYVLIATTRWRIWALMHVDNAEELIKLAEAEGILPHEGSWLWKLSIATRGQKEQLAMLNYRLQAPYTPLEDASVPETTDIYVYNNLRNLISFTILGVLLFVAVKLNSWPEIKWLADEHIRNAIAIIPVGLGLYTYYKWRNRKADKPAVTISNMGIETPELGCILWQEIRREHISVDYNLVHGNKTVTTTKTTHIVFRHHNDTVDIDVTVASERRRRINYLLKIYRNRHQQKLREEKKMKRGFR